MIKALSSIIWLLSAVMAYAVQPMPNGVSITWDRATNDLIYYVWRMNPPATNWAYIGSTTNNSFSYTNSFPDGTMFGVTVNQRMGNGVCCVASDIGVAGWPPSITTPQNTVRVVPANGYVVDTNRWVKVSSDMAIFDDWLRFSYASNGVRVEHRVSPLKPRLFMLYHTITNPPPPFP